MSETQEVGMSPMRSRHRMRNLEELKRSREEKVESKDVVDDTASEKSTIHPGESSAAIHELPSLSAEKPAEEVVTIKQAENDTTSLSIRSEKIASENPSVASNDSARGTSSELQTYELNKFSSPEQVFRKDEPAISKKSALIKGETAETESIGTGTIVSFGRKTRQLEIDQNYSDMVSGGEYSFPGESGDKRLRFGDDDSDNIKQSAHISTKGMRFEYGECPKTCEKYLRVEDYARIFVDEITNEAMTKQKDYMQYSAVKVAEGITYTEDQNEGSLSIESIGTYVCVFEWPTIEEFTCEVGTAKINEFLSYWKFEEEWKYWVDFMYGKSDSFCDFYLYQAKFGIPSKPYPIAEATASVFFTFEVSRIRPTHCLVDLSYRFEGQRSIHRPGNFTFQENKLFNIVDAKLKFYETLTF